MMPGVRSIAMISVQTTILTSPQMMPGVRSIAMISVQTTILTSPQKW